MSLHDDAACTVQRAFRCFLARSLYYENAGMLTAAVALQSAWRCHLSREFWCLLAAAPAAGAVLGSSR
jgi:hypothetical protein